MAHFEDFIGKLNGERKAEFVASRKKRGVRERAFHQHTPMGDFVIVTLEGDDPAGAFAKFGAGDDPFTKWFSAEVASIHGLDLSAPPPGPLPRLVIDSGA
ncbi:hypothetical protein OSH11_03665 [Kaistia dalseonensis]|uniref:Uncharacterized protein n=1 Tax=Kaistia dalseonensis TaxID=410840 RepID=A0ABU0H3J2_9HYPH|nr:hypothetical protein [Kaistia dalseonensis]MCX5493795.1 hypothetical protein [Kaistia dalseonensis]MDQ0436360.1 hypothetical protein [Kaistia dalseonensis]